MMKTMKTISKWWRKRSATFSYISQEEVTHGEVVLTHAVVIGLLLVIGLAGWIGG